MTNNSGFDPITYSPAPRKFARDVQNNWLGGVCAGIARYFGIDATLVRVLFVVSCLLPGPQVLLYLLLWLVIPKG